MSEREAHFPSAAADEFRGQIVEVGDFEFPFRPLSSFSRRNDSELNYRDRPRDILFSRGRQTPDRRRSLCTRFGSFRRSSTAINARPSTALLLSVMRAVIAPALLSPAVFLSLSRARLPSVASSEANF